MHTKVSDQLGRQAVPAVTSLVILSFVLMAAFLVQIAWQQDRHAAEQARAFAKAALDRHREVIAKDVKDYAAWGEAYQHLHGRTDVDWAFGQQNLGRTLYTDLGYDDVLVAGPTGAIAYAVVAGDLVAAKQVTLAGPPLDHLVRNARNAVVGDGKPAVGYLVADGMPFLAAAMVITTGGDPTIAPQPGPPSILVLADALTPGRLAEIGEVGFAHGLTAEIAPQRIGGESQMVSKTEDEGTALLFRWTPEQPGKTLLLLVLPWLVVAGIAFSTLAILILRRTVRTALLIESNTQALAEAHRRTEHIALHDHVTGLANRTKLFSFLETALQRIEPPRLVAVLYIDLDRFKLINDLLGHRAGDTVLVETAARLRMVAHDEDLVSRVGGDEFVVILSDLHHSEEAERVGDRLLELIRAPVEVEGRSAQVGLSIGIAVVGADRQTADDVLRRADIAMYEAKMAGGDAYRLFSDEMTYERAMTG